MSSAASRMRVLVSVAAFLGGLTTMVKRATAVPIRGCSSSPEFSAERPRAFVAPRPAVNGYGIWATEGLRAPGEIAHIPGTWVTLKDWDSAGSIIQARKTFDHYPSHGLA
jgi:hypothetical protein